MLALVQSSYPTELEDVGIHKILQYVALKLYIHLLEIKLMKLDNKSIPLNSEFSAPQNV